LEKRSLGRRLITILDFVFSSCIVDLMGDLNSVFSSNLGNKAYNRSIILGIFLYCFDRHIHNLSDIAHECQVNEVLKIFTCGETPSIATLRRFLTDSDELVVKKVFLYTLVQLNDLGLLKFLRAFVDGTDALVNGSKNYTLKKDELKAMKLMKEWKLQHSGKPNSIKRVIRKLKVKERMFEDDEEISALIRLILGRIKLYSKKNLRRINEWEEIFNESDKDYISITFPSAVMLPTKKGNFDFGFNLQEIMTENNIIITGLLLQQPNDNLSMKDLLLELKENFTILRELIEKYGVRRNYKEIEKMLEKAIFVFDSGYFSDENLEALDQYGINGLIMPKLISRQINNEIREKNNLKTNKKQKTGKLTKKDFQRIYNAYLCKNNRKIVLIQIKKINSAKNKRKGITDSMKEQAYVHICYDCSDCLIQSKCLKDSKFKIIIDRVSTLKYEMINKFTQQKYLAIYQERFSVSEGINGYLKNTHGILHLVGSNKPAVKNEIQIRNTMYNLTRIVNLKGTAY